MSTSTPAVQATNLGPIPEYAFQFDDYGVTVLTARNGTGKSILLNSLKTAASGKGKLPLRDRARKGMLSVGGAVITIGGTTRHNGTFDIVNIEGRFDLAKLVDPGIKSPEAADQARIKSLISLLGVEATIKPFLDDPAFADLEKVVDSDILATDDLVLMAAKIKKAYDTAALEAERLAEREADRATAADAKAAEVDLEAECDGDKLQAKLEAAVRQETSIKQHVEECLRETERREEAKEKLAVAKANYKGPTVEQAAADEQAAIKRFEEAQAEYERIKVLLDKAGAAVTQAVHGKEAAFNVYVSARDHEETITAWRETLEGPPSDAPPEEEIEAAAKAVADARVAIEQGALIRDARNEAKKAIEHKDAAKVNRERAARLRTAAKCTDDVLSGLINCPLLRVDSTGGMTRVVTDHPVRGKNIPFEELSQGEKWRVAMKLGIDAVGAGGLLVIDQEPWEGLDAFVRPIIHAEAKEGKVYVVTAQATRDATESGDMQALHMDWQPIGTYEENLEEEHEEVLGRNLQGAVFRMFMGGDGWSLSETGEAVEPTHWKPLPE